MSIYTKKINHRNYYPQTSTLLSYGSKYNILNAYGKKYKSQLSQMNHHYAPHHVQHVINKGERQCDKIAMVVGRTKLTTLVTIDVPWRESRKTAKFRVWDKVPERSTVFLETAKFLSNTM